MFTGIIEELGTVRALQKTGDISKLQVWAPWIAEDCQVGQSISINGACLTVVQRQKALLTFEVMPETLLRTNLGRLREQDKVNLERALKADGRIDGHFVSGHIDTTGVIQRKKIVGADAALEIKPADALLRYVVLKGSVALDGVSLTVSALGHTTFSVSLIPYTLNNTTFGIKKEQDFLNIEFDLLGKYIVDKLSSQNRPFPASKLTSSFLKEQGF